MIYCLKQDDMVIKIGKNNYLENLKESTVCRRHSVVTKATILCQKGY